MQRQRPPTDETTPIEPGQTWRCNEARADPDAVPDPHTDALWADHPRFRATVDDVRDGVVTLVVGYGNDHPRAPDYGATIVRSAAKLRERDRWQEADR
ncbi:SNF2/RAD54 family helicase [Natrinema pallidum]|uniref:SNF2/RAD54 family helicase n=1 Tax=Natrinema pallidum TaxID=69527 RepID=A0A4P9TM05_9EURY|nr:SNF2/RAD54 family helicase [Natrinema pallidum]QCW05255.1 SNF2/RAD54 family helicase [Natrinema pallidum]